MGISNQVQLITYADSLGGDLNKLRRVLNDYFPDLFKGGVHILPPYPSSGDRGFAPLDYLQIDPQFGTWEDVQAIGDRHGIMLDVMVNHISRQSAYFQDFLKNGRKSVYADMFITLEKVWPDGHPIEADIDKMFLRRKTPYSTFRTEDGSEEKVWTTFGKTDPSEQIDLDIYSERTRRYFREIFDHFKAHNVNMVRLDAVGYVIKKLGTSCFFVEPDIYEFLDWIAQLAEDRGIALLPEVHSHYSIQYKLAERGFWIYDFILPYAILDALLNRSVADLRRYLQSRPANQITMLDCHDGIPVKPDLDDLIDTDKARRTVDICLQRGANLSYILSDEHKSQDGFDVHQIRCTYYSALNCDDDAYLAARAIQLFTPGVPQIYYVGLLAGANDYDRAEKIGDGREINRHNYDVSEIEQALQSDVVKRLMRLIRFRNEYAAFDGAFTVMDSRDQELKLEWRNDELYCRLFVNLEAKRTVIDYVDERGEPQQLVV